MNTSELQDLMSNYYCTDCYYKMPMLNMQYTDGVKAFAENAGAYWLLTDIALFVPKAKKANPTEYMFSVHLVVNKGKADLLFKDADDNVSYKRHYALTDCPDGDWIFYYYVNERLLIWNGEY